MSPKKMNGFSLLELIVVMVIAGLLAGIAYPSYQQHIQKSKRALGRVAVLHVMQQQERYMTQYNTYKEFIPNSTEETAFKTYAGDQRHTALYHIGAKKCTGHSTPQSCIEVYAIPTFSDPDIGWISLTSQGQKSCSQAPAATCWN